MCASHRTCELYFVRVTGFMSWAVERAKAWPVESSSIPSVLHFLWKEDVAELELSLFTGPTGVFLVLQAAISVVCVFRRDYRLQSEIKYTRSCG